jgi:hypothetical protein
MQALRVNRQTSMLFHFDKDLMSKLQSFRVDQYILTASCRASVMAINSELTAYRPAISSNLGTVSM